MAFNYNGVSPTSIKYGNTELTVLKYGTTAVWGKPYSLSISAGANTTVTVNRTSSPNQHASTGTLSSGSVIYYGDVLTISYSVSSGYKISTATVNGAEFTNGQSFTVTSAISVVTNAEVSASWHTVWTGSQNIAIPDAPTKTGNRSQEVSFEGIKPNVPTRFTTAKIRYYQARYWPIMTEPMTLYTSGGVMQTDSWSTFSEQSSTYLVNSGEIVKMGLSVNTPTSANLLPVMDRPLYAG